MCPNSNVPKLWVNEHDIQIICHINWIGFHLKTKDYECAIIKCETFGNYRFHFGAVNASVRQLVSTEIIVLIEKIFTIFYMYLVAKVEWIAWQAWQVNRFDKEKIGCSFDSHPSKAIYYKIKAPAIAWIFNICPWISHALCPSNVEFAIYCSKMWFCAWQFRQTLKSKTKRCR